MSLRQEFPKAQIPRSHYFVTLARGERTRTVSIRPWVLFSFIGVLPLVGLWYLCATAYLIFRDDMLASLMTRQAQLQYVYEDRLAAMRGELDRVTSRQLLDQSSFEGKVHELLSRQAQLESRANIVASLADLANGRDVTAYIARPGAENRTKPAGKTAINTPVPPALGATVTGFAPLNAPPTFPPLTNAKPRPEASETSSPANPRTSQADVPVSLQIGGVATALDRIELDQVRSIALLQAPASATAARLKNALADVGLSADKLSAPNKVAAMGGPYIPLKVDPNGSPFEREVARLQDNLLRLAQLRGVMAYVPLRAPLPDSPDITSGFGYRIDPFLGRPALHPGIDFREPLGALIRATAAGKVVTAAMTGGYGNMVEIEHGNDLATRYGHMSAVLVSEGQWVEAGTILGRVGSTGRSTGPHLHYEVRVNDEPVDPGRYLKAGARLAGLSFSERAGGAAPSAD